MLSDRYTYPLLALIVALFVGIGVLYVIYTPPWQAPDEPAHYNYVAQVAGEGCCPIIEPDDWDADHLEQLKAEGFPEGADLSSIAYEDHQPPLYYLLASLVYKLGGGNLIALRLASVACGAGVVLAAYFAVARLLPRRRILALAVAAFVAFLPQHVAIMASVNNDSLAEMVLGILLVVSVTYLGNPLSIDHRGEPQPYAISRRPHAAALGGLLGVAFLTKLTIYLPAALVVGLAIVLRWRIEHQEPLSRPARRWLAAELLWAAGMALALGGIWWVRNGIVYGWPDLLGQAAHEAVVVGQLRTADYIAQIGFWPYLGRFLSTTYHSFWGQFGWLGVPMPSRDYLLIGLFLLWDMVGLLVVPIWLSGHLRLEPGQRAGIWLLVATVLAAAAGYLGYNLAFVQFQGRYLYPALIALGTLVALGAWGWSRLLVYWRHGDLWARILRWMPLLALVWMPLLALWALFRYIVPYLE